MSAATFTGTLSFGTYRTIVLDPQQPSFQKMAASVFHSTNLTADGSRQFSGICSQNIVPGHAVPVAIKPGPSKTSFEKIVTSLLRSTISEQMHEECDAANCRQPRSRDIMFRYLSYDSFGSSTTSIRKDGRFRVSFNKLDSRWEQTVFSGRCWQNIVPGLAVPVAIEPGSSTTAFEKIVISLLRSTI